MLKTITHEKDICIVGGGMAGLCAAVAAARQGKTVALVQERPMLGGNASSEIRMWVCGAQGRDNRETGIIEEINLENLYRNPAKNYSVWDSVLYGKVLAEPNIELFLNTSVCEADLENGKLKTVIGWQMTTESWHHFTAAYFIDCTGDGLLAELSHAPYRIGREAPEEFNEKVSIKEADSQTMGLSCLIQAKWTEEETTFIAPSWAKQVTDEELALRMPHMDSSYENFWYLELGGDRDSIGDTETVRDELVALAYGYWDKYKNSGKFPEAGHWQLEFLGFLPGKRESRRIVGPHVLSQNDVVSGGHFPDTVAYGGWGLDDHDPRGFYHKGAPNQCGETGIYGIPFRCLYSAAVDNLLFAGRNISTTHAALSSTRVMMTCAVLGQAAGTGAALAVELNTSLDEIDSYYIEELQQRLLRADCFLPGFTRKSGRPMEKATVPEKFAPLTNGLDRDHELYGTGSQALSVALGEKIEYSFEQPCYVELAHLTFDSDLNRDTLPGDECERYHSMRCNLMKDSPLMHLPTTLVRDFDLILTYPDGHEETREFRDWIKRSDEVVVDACVAKIALRLLSNWGGGDEARLYAFDLY